MSQDGGLQEVESAAAQGEDGAISDAVCDSFVQAVAQRIPGVHGPACTIPLVHACSFQTRCVTHPTAAPFTPIPLKHLTSTTNLPHPTPPADLPLVSRPSVLVTSVDEVGTGVHEFLASASAAPPPEVDPPARDFSSVAAQCASQARGLDALLQEAVAGK